MRFSPEALTYIGPLFPNIHGEGYSELEVALMEAFDAGRRLPIRRKTERRRTPKFAAMVRRMVTALGRRHDIESMVELVQLLTYVEETARGTILALKDDGHSWADLARHFGISRQAMQKRWHHEERDEATR